MTGMRDLAAWVALCLLGAGTRADAGATDWSALCKRGTATVAPELTVGGGDEESEDEPPFLKLHGVAAAADGSFYVLDGDGYVVHFGAGGEELRRFARNGEGPGELRDPFGIDIDAQGRVVVYDSGNHRFAFFKADGTFIVTRPHREFITRFDCTPDGRIVVEDEPAEMPRPGGKQLHRLLVFDADLNPLAVVDSTRAMKFQVLAREGGYAMASSPFAAELVFCVLSDGSIAYAMTDTYELRVVGPDLKPRAVLGRRVPPPPITDGDREDYYAGFADSGEEFVAWLKRDTAWPKHRPYIEDLFASGTAVVVVREYAAARAVLDVFAGDRFAGTVEAAGFRRPRDVRDGVFFSGLREEGRLPGVVRFRLQ